MKIDMLVEARTNETNAESEERRPGRRRNGGQSFSFSISASFCFHMDDEMKLFRICKRRPVFFSEEETALNWNIIILWRCFRLIFIKQTYINKHF